MTSPGCIHSCHHGQLSALTLITSLRTPLLSQCGCSRSTYWVSLSPWASYFRMSTKPSGWGNCFHYHHQECDPLSACPPQTMSRKSGDCCQESTLLPNLYSVLERWVMFVETVLGQTAVACQDLLYDPWCCSSVYRADHMEFVELMMPIGHYNCFTARTTYPSSPHAKGWRLPRHHIWSI